jgi:hypothetical protein
VNWSSALSLPFPASGEGREAAPGSPKADDFKAWIIGGSGGYRNLAVRGKKAAGGMMRGDPGGDHKGRPYN